MKTVLRNSYSPKVGDYCETIVVDLEKQIKYIFDCDGVFTPISGGLTEDVQKAIDDAVAGEATLREGADQEIWTEIETIEMSSDVVDIVGTYTELQNYDTSKLKDNDIIKVLSDSTHSDATSYYRWSTASSTFSFVGSEGPYYTESQVDTLLSGKQDTLIAGTNISIAADGKTISATDTTYTHFTGATASTDGTQGLVPAPIAGDQSKFLSADGTWQTVSSGASNTIFYRNSSETGSTRHIYKNADMTGAASMQDLLDANENGQVILRLSTASHPEDYSDAYLQNAYVGTNDYQMLFLDEKAYTSFDTTAPTDTTFYYSRRELQDKLTAGTNVQINGTTISATDTTYSAFTGATTQDAGTSGLVPAPASSLKPYAKFLCSNGTWSEIDYEETVNQLTPFVGATASVTGIEGLVPAPATTDTNKYLKGDGTWATVSAGPAVVQTTGQSTTDVMSQKAVTDIIGNIETALQILNSGAGVP